MKHAGVRARRAPAFHDRTEASDQGRDAEKMKFETEPAKSTGKAFSAPSLALVLTTASATLIVLIFGLVSCVHAGSPPTVDDATEVNKELSNPISSIWALQIQENTFFIHPGIEDKSSGNAVNVQFQPVPPLALTDDWNLITRPVFQVINSVPVPTRTGRIYQATGFGDTILATSSFAEPESDGTVAPWRRTDLHLSKCDHDKCRPEKVAARPRWGCWVPG